MKKLVFLFLMCSLFSCFQPQNNEAEKTVAVSSIKNSIQKHAEISPVKKTFLNNITNWPAYRNVHELLKRYEQISPNEALNNALELKDLTQTLKDSIGPKILQIPSFQARLNVLHNESLRLADMTYISAITAEEINAQVAKILVVFSSVNEKINTVFTQKKFDDEIKINAVFVGLDSTKLAQPIPKKKTNIAPPPPPKKRN